MKSAPVKVQVMSKVKNPEILFNQDPLVNKSLTFTALLYSGSDVTLTWDFGDSSSVVTSNNYRDKIKHTYAR